MPTELKRTQWDYIWRAVRIANAEVRKSLLDDAVNSLFREQLTDITGSSLSELKKTWNPFVPDITAQSGLGLRFAAPDNLVLQLMKDMDLFDKAYNIAIDAFMSSIWDDPKPFIETMINDLVEADSFYEKFATEYDSTI